MNCNTSECWTVLIHTSDKRPSHSHCYQVNDCQVTYIKNILLLKGGQYFYTEKKYVPPFVSKNILLTKGGQYFCTEKKYVPPFVSKIFFILKGWQCLNKCTSPLITKILLLQSFTYNEKCSSTCHFVCLSNICRYELYKILLG